MQHVLFGAAPAAAECDRNSGTQEMLQSVTGSASSRAGSMIIISAQLTSLASSAPPRLEFSAGPQPGNRLCPVG